MTGRTATLLGVDDYDNPETIRFKKYAMGLQLILQGTGIETGHTPKEVVWTRQKAKLYHYEPEKAKRYPVPILLVYALILRPYILDLVPGNSLVEYLTKRGFDVYLLDWGAPASEDKNLSFEDYVLEYLPEAVENVLRSSRADELTLFGYCQGGTMAAMYVSLFPEHLKNLVLLATPTDFAPEDPGLFGLWTVLTSERYFDPDPVVETFGNVPGDLPGRLVQAGIRPLAGYASPWRRMEKEEPLSSLLAVSKWVDDGVPFPGEAFRQWIRDFYQQNKLARGDLKLRGRWVELSNIVCPVLNIAGEKDYICPLSQAKSTIDLVGSEDKEMIVLDAGHVGLMAGPVTKEELWPRVISWLEPRSG